MRAHCSIHHSVYVPPWIFLMSSMPACSMAGVGMGPSAAIVARWSADGRPPLHRAAGDAAPRPSMRTMIGATAKRTTVPRKGQHSKAHPVSMVTRTRQEAAQPQDCPGSISWCYAIDLVCTECHWHGRAADITSQPCARWATQPAAAHHRPPVASSLRRVSHHASAAAPASVGAMRKKLYSCNPPALPW